MSGPVPKLEWRGSHTKLRTPSLTNPGRYQATHIRLATPESNPMPLRSQPLNKLSISVSLSPSNLDLAAYWMIEPRCGCITTPLREQLLHASCS